MNAFMSFGYGLATLEGLLQLLEKQQGFHLFLHERSPEHAWNNQFVDFTPSDSVCLWPVYSSKVTSACSSLSGSFPGSNYYISGGNDGRTRSSDLYVLDMNTLNWQEMNVFPCHDPVAMPSNNQLDNNSVSHLYGAAINEALHNGTSDTRFSAQNYFHDALD